jgi:hypothetical protein
VFLITLPLAVVALVLAGARAGARQRGPEPVDHLGGAVDGAGGSVILGINFSSCQTRAPSGDTVRRCARIWSAVLATPERAPNGLYDLHVPRGAFWVAACAASFDR